MLRPPPYSGLVGAGRSTSSSVLEFAQNIRAPYTAGSEALAVFIAAHMPGAHFSASIISRPSGACGSEVSPRAKNRREPARSRSWSIIRGTFMYLA